KGDYPEDLFSLEQRQQGWVLLHVLGMVYMFVALAIVCDEFFVPGLEVITNKLEISDDVAGATFMAAGGSAPELFTSLIGVFISHSNVGIGTIVGSAVFNILFVIGMCAISSREMLHLTWWPLFRDVTFYILDLLLLIVFFLDNVILWWESVLLVLAYVSYVSFMKFNSQLERALKAQLNKHASVVKAWTADDPEKVSGPTPDARPVVRPALQRGGSSASLHNTSLRNTIFQLMIHTLDPLGEVWCVSAHQRRPLTGVSEGRRRRRGELIHSQEQSQTSEPANQRQIIAAAPVWRSADVDEKPGAEESAAGGAAAEPSTSRPQEPGGSGSEQPEQSQAEARSSESSSHDDSEEEPLSLAWPDTRRKRLTYLLLLPIVFPLWLTLPDVRNPASRKYFVLTFIGSIMWIGVFSYLMVWWAHQVGETVGISEEIMGLTILAAGTSIPDLITSVIVARKGLGDMAVSSSVGSNIFDITVGLPVPWLLFILLHQGEPVTVSSNGLFCAIVLLFLMLLFVIVSIAACRWRMSRMLGLTMFVLYLVFLVLSVLLEVRVLTCPVSI
uniref:Sodium/potassium/calcium exchanger 1 n=1 Tax=Tetraodon nigroviridis TaxID=99883 RepID=H3DN90_TETNG